jgi:hypothetical protein
VTEPRLHVLHALRLRGLATDTGVADATGLPAALVGELLAQLLAEGLAGHRGGRLPGFTLTAQGKAEHAARIATDLPAEARPRLDTGYAAFLPLNATFKQLCTEWQLRPTAEGATVPNDHADAGYDATIVERLGVIHGDLAPVLADVAHTATRFGRYQPRLAAALDRVRAGDRTAFARPLSDSYHDVWMELHEDFLLSLGRSRDHADGD